jgi:hypothetical protein
MRKNKTELVKRFITNDIERISNEVKQHIMAFNLLEITGMKMQEIKHSNILLWMFGANQHKLGYKIFEIFLKKIMKKNVNTNFERLKQYVNLCTKNIKFYREKDNIDLLAVDYSNKVVIVIENKIYAKERDSGDDGGQLKKYFDFINHEYKNFDKFFIYLTLDEKMPSAQKNQDIWLVASYIMIGESIEDILKEEIDSNETILILQSYVDLLKRKNIMEDKKLKELCETIWDNQDYANAIDIINQYRMSKLDKLYNNLYKKFLAWNEAESNYWIKTKMSEELYKTLINKSWNNESDVILFDLCIHKDKNEIWFGYVHSKNILNTNQVLQQLYFDLFQKKSKFTSQTLKIKIHEDDIKEQSLDELTEKYLDEFQKEIQKFESAISKVLKEK